jgi:hypothetical protein
MAKKSPDKLALDALDAALNEVVRVASAGVSPTITRRIRQGLTEHVLATEAARAATDPVGMPTTTFDPSDPKVVGRMVALALLAQVRVPLSSIKPSYGSGVYAIYYEGDHPFYRAISGSETPIYVGKADPMSGDASTSREQGPKLTGRLLEHAGTIATAETYAKQSGLPEGCDLIELKDFTCRRLVCATNAQLVTEKHLIHMFWPLWNSETKACWGMSKHGDAATTRKNKRSPWDVVHPGRAWALDGLLEDSLSLSTIEGRINEVLEKTPPKTDHASLLEEVLAAFRQEGPIPPEDEAPAPISDDQPGPSEDEAGGSDD